MNTRVSIAYIGLIVTSGLAIVAHGFWTWQSDNPGKFLSYLLIALAASGMKIRLPSVEGTMSVNFVFLLFGISQFSLGETLLMGSGAALVQSVFHAKTRPTAVKLAFNFGSLACAIETAWMFQHSLGINSGLITAAAFFVANTVSVTIIIALTEHKSAWTVWRDSYLWSFPNYLVGAAVVWMMGETGKLLGWQAALFLFPVLYFIYRSHRLYVERLEEAKRRADQEAQHALEVAAMHRRTIETLALAVEAKDQTTHDHLERVETYAVAVGKEMGFGENEVEALRAAALLHDIGKLAVPEYIIAKPGKLTQEEFAQMKTHTVVGAEIVERMRFPYEVAPLVRGHHEKWDGSGYPDGLAGERIPIGARILAAVDCLDALSSDRQYRRAMPLSDSMEVIRSEAGKSFDPRVVEILSRRYIELDALVRSAARIEKLPIGVPVSRGEAPAAGFEKIATCETVANDLSAIDRAVRNSGSVRQPIELTARIAASISREAALSSLGASLRELVSCDAIVVYCRFGQKLRPVLSDSREFALLISTEIEVGEGLSGWVAENGKAIVNGNPAVEPGYVQDPSRFSVLHSAVAVPLFARSGIVGVLSLYRRNYDAFTSEDLAMVTLLGTHCGEILEADRIDFEMVVQRSA
jgi:putative nucleotidyltransferase with HDIG domain